MQGADPCGGAFICKWKQLLSNVAPYGCSDGVELGRAPVPAARFLTTLLMHNPEQQAHHAHSQLHLAQRWHRARAAYRLANRASHHVLGFTVKLVLLAYFLFTFLFLFLRYAVLPNIDYYKGDIEHAASRALGNQVAITRLYASWKGLRPHLFLGDVILRDRQGRTVLSLPSVSATLSWWSVLSASPRFHQLEIIRPDLDVRRDARGRVSVAGIVLDPKQGDSTGSDWLFAQRRVIVRDGKLRWTDELRGAPELALDGVELLLVNRWNHHRLALRATPPASLSGPVDIRADFRHPRFTARVSDLAQWSGELYGDVRDTNLAGWKPYLNYPFEVTSGKGSVRAWLTLDHARLDAFTADLGLVDVRARLAPDLPPLELTRVAGRLSASEAALKGAPETTKGKLAFGAHGHSMALSGFTLTTRAGLVLAPTTISEAYVPASGGKPERFHLSAQQLDLATLSSLATQLPLAPSQRAMLADFAPRGSLTNFSAIWHGTYPAVSAYRVQGRLSGLGIRPQPARLAQPKSATVAATAALPALPGFDNLSGTIDASEAGGTIALDSKDLILRLPAWMPEASMQFDQASLKARWSFAPKDQLLINIDGLDLSQGALRAHLAGRHQMPLVAQSGKAAGLVDLHGTVTGFDVKDLPRFLPLNTPPALAGWLTTAIEAGVLHDGTLRLRGELSQFPFRDPARGEFRIAGRIENGRLNYAPALLAPDGKAALWPQAEQINGTIVFDRARMDIHAVTARTLGVALADVKASVPDLFTPERMLEIDGSATGPMQEFLRYVGASPVAGWIGHFTDHTLATGNARLGLKLQLPLAHLKDAKVQGALQLTGNDVVLLPELPPLQAAIGTIEFSERGVQLNGLGASFLGGPLALSGGTVPGAGIVIKLGGTVSAEGIRKTWPAPAAALVTARLQGATRFSGAVTVKDGQASVTVDSNLAGLGLEFPAPLNKAAAEVLPVHFTLTGVAPGMVPQALATADGPVQRDDIRITLGSQIHARYLRQRLAKGPWKVVSGGVGVNVPAPEQDEGMMVNVNMRSLNVDQWIALAGKVANAAPPAGPVTGEPGVNLAQYVVPDVIAARATELIIGDRKLDSVMVGASHQQRTWQASIDSRQVSGHVAWDEGPAGQGLGKVSARLASLIIPESSKADVKDLLEGGKSAASSIPALDIVAERFELFNKQLGRLELVANNAQASTGREWQISKLLLVNPDGVLKTTGKWSTRDGNSSTNVNFVLDITDAGKLLDRFGFPDTIRRGKGRMSGDIAWNGLPYSLDTASLSGTVQMDVKSGQFLKQDPGAAKLLGVLSLQMLPRMLKLDFHDVFSEGLAFDGISATATITRGVARTDNLRMHGVAATVLMDGTADIANETTNLHVVVIPEFNLGTGPLVYALAVNPVIGLGSFLAQLFLRAPVMKALTYHMQIAGPWKAPVVTKLDGGKLEPVAPAAAAAQDAVAK